MRRKLSLLLVFAIIALYTQAQRPVSVIFDTDIGPDYDDVGAIALLHAFADSGKANILATMASNKYEGIAAVLNVFNTYFHRPSLPIGIPKGRAVNIRDRQHWTDSILAKYPHAINHNSEVPDAITLYRSILATQPDHSVVIITVGFLTNLAGLLQTGADSLSPLNGRQLVSRKVRLLVSMAGTFPQGREFNIFNDAPAAIAVSREWPSPIIFSGFEIGRKIKCGLPIINDAAILNSPVKDVFRISIPQAGEDASGRMSWDETAVLVGIAGYAPWYTLRYGHIQVDTLGANTWTDSAGPSQTDAPSHANATPQVHAASHAHATPRLYTAPQAHLEEALPPATVQALIDTLIMHQPVQPAAVR